MANSFTPIQIDFFEGDPFDNSSLLIDNIPKATNKNNKDKKSKKNKKKKKPKKLFRKYSTILNNPRKKGHYLIKRILRRIRIIDKIIGGGDAD